MFNVNRRNGVVLVSLLLACNIFFYIVNFEQVDAGGNRCKLIKGKIEGKIVYRIVFFYTDRTQIYFVSTI